MWWTTSMPLTCHCTLKRESGRHKFSTVERLPWQLVVLISMLQRVRGESLIISAWQRGPTDRAKVKRKPLCSTWEPQLLISSCSAQSCVKLCGGEKSGASLCYSLISFFSSFFLCLSLLSLYQHPHSVSMCAVSKIFFWTKKWVNSWQFLVDLNYLKFWCKMLKPILSLQG